MIEKPEETLDKKEAESLKKIEVLTNPDASQVLHFFFSQLFDVNVLRIRLKERLKAKRRRPMKLSKM